MVSVLMPLIDGPAEAHVGQDPHRGLFVGVWAPSGGGVAVPGDPLHERVRGGREQELAVDRGDQAELRVPVADPGRVGTGTDYGVVRRYEAT